VPPLIFELPISRAISLLRQINALNINVAGVILGQRDIVESLQLAPHIGSPSESLVQTDRHLGRDPGAAIDHGREMPSAYAEPAGGFGDRQSERLDAIESNR